MKKYYKVLLIVTFTLLTTCLGFLRYLDYQSVQEPRNAEVVKVDSSCGRKTCYYYAIVYYKGELQEINIGQLGYLYYKKGRSYDFSPEFSWWFGTSGYAYAVSSEKDVSLMLKVTATAIWLAFLFFTLSCCVKFDD